MACGALVYNHSRYRRLLGAAKLAGYTYMRVWGGGNIEDQSFYDLCDEMGIMLQQDFPAAGCGYTLLNASGGSEGALSWSWINEPATPEVPSLAEGYRLQMPRVTAQLINHPSVVRYTLGNEFYANRTWCPVQALFEDTMLQLDPSRMTRQADPTNVGQRHGPYVFDILGGSGYDCWGGRWPHVGGCDASNYRTEECCPLRLGNDTTQPGCRYTSSGDSGPGDPFEWSEGGAVGMSDLETLREILPPSSLTPSAVGDSLWGFHKAGSGPQGGGMWLDEAGWAPLFVSDGKAASFRSMQAVVRASQFAQAEAYRFIYQAGRRRKPHRSLLATWTFDEPWPNAAHGSIIDYYGRPKMAFSAVKAACAMVDISLSYSDVWVLPGKPMNVTLWIDNELHEDLELLQVTVEFFDLHGAQVAPDFVTGQGCPSVNCWDAPFPCSVCVNASANVMLQHFGPSRRTLPAGLDGVMFVRASLYGQAPENGTMDNALLSRHDYTFAVAKTRPVAPFASLLDAPAANFTIERADGGSVEVANAAGAPCALFVKLTLRLRHEDGNLRASTDVPYAIFARNHFVLRPSEVLRVPVEQGLEDCAGVGGCEVCAEAWNSRGAQCVHL